MADSSFASAPGSPLRPPTPPTPSTWEARALIAEAQARESQAEVRAQVAETRAQVAAAQLETERLRAQLADVRAQARIAELERAQPAAPLVAPIPIPAPRPVDAPAAHGRPFVNDTSPAEQRAELNRVMDEAEAPLSGEAKDRRKGSQDRRRSANHTPLPRASEEGTPGAHAPPLRTAPIDPIKLELDLSEQGKSPDFGQLERFEAQVNRWSAKEQQPAPKYTVLSSERLLRTVVSANPTLINAASVYALTNSEYFRLLLKLGAPTNKEDSLKLLSACAPTLGPVPLWSLDTADSLLGPWLTYSAAFQATNDLILDHAPPEAHPEMRSYHHNGAMRRKSSLVCTYLAPMVKVAPSVATELEAELTRTKVANVSDMTDSTEQFLRRLAAARKLPDVQILVRLAAAAAADQATPQAPEEPLRLPGYPKPPPPAQHQQFSAIARDPPQGDWERDHTTDEDSPEARPLRDYTVVSPLQLQAMAHNALNPTLPSNAKACYELLYKAQCSKGEACPYSHDKTVAAAHLRAEEKKIKDTRIRLGLNSITPTRGYPGSAPPIPRSQLNKALWNPKFDPDHRTSDNDED